MNGIINANTGAHTLTHNKIIIPFNKAKKTVLFPEMNMMKKNLHLDEDSYFLLFALIHNKIITSFSKAKKTVLFPEMKMMKKNLHLDEDSYFLLFAEKKASICINKFASGELPKW